MAVEQVIVGARTDRRVASLGAAQAASPSLHELYLYWRAKWQDGRLPGCTDIEPLDIPALLPQVYLVDVEREPLRFRFRLVGTRIVAWLGRDTTGQEIAPDLVERYREAVTTGRPLFDSLSLAGKAGRQGCYQRVLLPLAGANGSIEMLLGGVQPTPSAT